jgi:hypothetical protein
MDRIKNHIAKQTKQQEKLQQVFKLCQLMKLLGQGNEKSASFQ